MLKPSSLQRAAKFKWASVLGVLHPERLSHLEKYVCDLNVLDAGCAGGGYVEYLAQKNLNVVGVDNDDELLGSISGQGRRGTYVRADVEALPFRDKTFDCTYCFDVLEHVNDLVLIRELARVTTNRLILTVPKEDETEMSGFGVTFFHYQDKTHLRNYTESSLGDLVSSIPSSRVRIFPELAIPFNNLVRGMIKGADAKTLARRVPHRVLARVLDRVQYEKVYTGLVAIVDL
jgi:SAM-dependent methyltransferase